MTIALSTDHAGFEQKNLLKKWLEDKGHQVIDFGPQEFDSDDDYPDFIFPAAEAVARGECEVGIIFGGSGQGEAIAANRIKGVRCGVFYGPAKAKAAVDAEGNESSDEYEILRLNRQHNYANMLSLAGRFLDMDSIERAIEIWLGTEPSSEVRHKRRVEKLDK